VDQLQGVESLIVRQRKEWGEILSGIETKNRYEVQDETGRTLFYAAEVGGNFLLRIFLRALRPFEMIIANDAQQNVLFLSRPFRFFFSSMLIMDSNHYMVGRIQRKFALLKRVYAVCDSNGDEAFRIIGPWLHPWTFYIEKNAERVGKIVKRWSGILKEAMTDADNFTVTFPQVFDVKQKALVLGSVFLIDFVHFENKGKN